MLVESNDNTRDFRKHRLLKGFIFLIEDIPLCFNYHNKTIILLRQNTTTVYNSSCLILAVKRCQ
jgi:hypothetical protein